MVKALVYFYGFLIGGDLANLKLELTRGKIFGGMCLLGDDTRKWVKVWLRLDCLKVSKIDGNTK